MKLCLVHNSEHFISDSYCYYTTALQLGKLWLGVENWPKVSRKISSWVRTRTQASWPSMQSTSKYTKGPKALRSYPPRAVNGQHGFKSKSSPRFSTSTREEGRCESTWGSSSRRSKPASLWPKAEPAGVYSQDIQIQDAALGQRQQVFWRLLAHLLWWDSPKPRSPIGFIPRNLLEER